MIALAFAFSMLLSACGDAESGDSVHFDWNGISLIEGEITDDAYPLVSICPFAEGAYERRVADAKDSDSYEEADGVITFVDSIGERNYLLMVDGKVPASVVFAEGIDKEKADEIMASIHIEAR